VGPRRRCDDERLTTRFDERVVLYQLSFFVAGGAGLLGGLMLGSALGGGFGGGGGFDAGGGGGGTFSADSGGGGFAADS
jgi:hypothetical protein